MATQHQPLIRENQAVVIRRATPDDAAVCGRIAFEAFATLAKKHNFPPDFPDPERSTHVLFVTKGKPLEMETVFDLGIQIADALDAAACVQVLCT